MKNRQDAAAQTFETVSMLPAFTWTAPQGVGIMAPVNVGTTNRWGMKIDAVGFGQYGMYRLYSLYLVLIQGIQLFLGLLHRQ
jgi:hypothetical protein